MKSASPANQRMFKHGADGYPMLRVWRRGARGKMSARLLLKCGDCDKALEIYHGDDSMEIGGVHASVEEWKRILLPLILIGTAPQSSDRARNRVPAARSPKPPGPSQTRRGSGD